MGSHAADTQEVKDGPEVVSVSKRNKGVRVIRVVRPKPEEASYISATIKGLGVTLKHFVKNVGRKKGKLSPTLRYPEEKIPYPERNRGLHRLMLRDNGNVRCVACMCCPTVCPANCITIIPAETDDQGVEKFPAVFEIDELRCVVCGLCVESCPCDAIRMDTGEHAMPSEDRARGVLGKDELMSRGELSLATQGGSGPDWRDE